MVDGQEKMIYTPLLKRKEACQKILLESHFGTDGMMDGQLVYQ